MLLSSPDRRKHAATFSHPRSGHSARCDGEWARSVAFFTLDVIGHHRIPLLDGGLAAWKAEKRPIELGPPQKPKQGAFNPTLNAARLADAAFIQQQMTNNGISLLDIRPDPEYLGTDGGMSGVHAPGHIPGAQQLPWTTLLGEDGRFLAPLSSKRSFAPPAPTRAGRW